MNMGFFRPKRKTLTERSLDEIKVACKVLFIDDKKFPVVDILKNAGWQKTARIRDVDCLEQMEVSEAHILFVDIQGVGKKMKFADEGLGLIIALKNMYPSKKIVVYSAEDQGSVAAFHPGIDMADKRLSKQSDPYQFQVIVEEFAHEIFSLEACIQRIKKFYFNELGHSIDEKDILKKLNLLSRRGVTQEKVSKVFNIQNASALTNIVQVFMSTV